MRQQQFEEAHQKTWRDLRGWLNQEATLDAQEVPPAYRQLCDHLAVARERRYSLALLDQLQQLALEAHQRLYGACAGSGRTLLDFVLGAFPRLVRRERRWILASALLFGLPLVAALLAVRSHPDLVYLIMSPQEAADMLRMYSPAADGGYTFMGASRDVSMFGFYIHHNIGLDFQCFASGLLAGIGPVIFLALNGLSGGAAMAHIANHGLTHTFYGFVSGHSSFELIGAVLSGAGGLRMGMGLLRPGRRSRLEALKEGASIGGQLVMGAALLTFIAACFEGFWSASLVLPWNLKVAVGLGFWALLLGWLTLAGRRRA